MIYLESPAGQIVRREPGTAVPVTWLGARPSEPLVSSALVEVEVPRAGLEEPKKFRSRWRRYLPSTSPDTGGASTDETSSWPKPAVPVRANPARIARQAQ